MEAIWLRQQCAKRTASEAGDIEKEHLHTASSNLKHSPQLVQQVHVEGDVQESEVNEARWPDTVPLGRPLGYQRTVESKIDLQSGKRTIERRESIAGSDKDRKVEADRIFGPALPVMLANISFG